MGLSPRMVASEILMVGLKQIPFAGAAVEAVESLRSGYELVRHQERIAELERRLTSFDRQLRSPPGRPERRPFAQRPPRASCWPGRGYATHGGNSHSRRAATSALGAPETAAPGCGRAGSGATEPGCRRPATFARSSHLPLGRTNGGTHPRSRRELAVWRLTAGARECRNSPRERANLTSRAVGNLGITRRGPRPRNSSTSDCLADELASITPIGCRLLSCLQAPDLAPSTKIGRHCIKRSPPLRGREALHSRNVRKYDS
jgi:hypothetical protein